MAEPVQQRSDQQHDHQTGGLPHGYQPAHAGVIEFQPFGQTQLDAPQKGDDDSKVEHSQYSSQCCHCY